MIKPKILTLLLLFTLLLVPTVVLASDISNAEYYGIITVSNNATATTYVSVNYSLNTQALIDGGFINSSANNCVVRNTSGSDIPFMPSVNSSYPWCAWVNAIGTNSYINYLFYTNATGGEIRYFPGIEGMTTPDSASLEFSDNFTYETKGWVDTSATINRTIVFKEEAFILLPYSDNVVALMYDAVAGEAVEESFASADSQQGVYGSNWICQTFTPSTTFYVTKFGVWSQKIGAPTGDAIVSIRATSGSSPTGEDAIEGTKDVATWRVGWGEETVSLDSVVLLVEGFEYAVIFRVPTGDASNRVDVGFNSTGGYPNGTRLTSSDSGVTWADQSNDFRFYIYGEELNVLKSLSSGVSTENHTITVEADTSYFRQFIDGVESDNVSLGGDSVPDNSANWTFMFNFAMPYMEYQEISVNGVQVQYIEWEYDTTFNDTSGSSNDATPTFRVSSSDADVSAEFALFQPIEEAQAPAFVLSTSVGNIVTENLTTTGTFETTPTPTGFPGKAVIEDISTASGTPAQLPFVVLAGFVIMVCSLSTTYFLKRHGSGSLFIKITVIVSLLGIFIALEMLDFWLLVFFLIIAVALSYASKQAGVA